MSRPPPHTKAFYRLSDEERIWWYRYSINSVKEAAKKLGVGVVTARNLLDSKSFFTKELIEKVKNRIKELQVEDVD